MIAKGEGSVICEAATDAMENIGQQLRDDEPQLKKLYDLRLSDEAHKKAWETAELGRKRAMEIMRRLGEIERQAKELYECEVTLSAEECALFSYAKNA